MTNSVRVFVAATPSEWLPMRVLEFSIRESTPRPLEVSALYTFDRPIPMPQAKKNWPRTPFSFQRFLIPELCGYQGKAIYLDADMLVFRDIAELWKQPLNCCDLQTVRETRKGLPSQFSVMLLDCSQLGWKIEEIVRALDSSELDYEGLMYEMCLAKKIGWDLPPEWNLLEHYEPGVTALLHYTEMPFQPWVSLENHLGNLWFSCLRRAMASGFISQTELEREVAVGHVRPSILLEAEISKERVKEFQDRFREVDKDFIAPFKRIRCGGFGQWAVMRTKFKSLVRRLCN